MFDGHGLNKDDLMFFMQKTIKRNLNPLFKIHDLVLYGCLAEDRIEKGDPEGSPRPVVLHQPDGW